MLLLFFSLSFQLQFLNFRPLTQNVLSTNKASNRKMCNNGFNIMTAFVCLQCLGAVTSDFFLIQLVFQFSCNIQRPNFPLLDPLKRLCSKTYIGCWLSTGHSFAALVLHYVNRIRDNYFILRAVTDHFLCNWTFQFFLVPMARHRYKLSEECWS